MKSIRFATCATLLLIMVFGCALPQRNYRESASELAEELVLQLEQRVDTRNMRVLVIEFRPCERMADGSLLPMVDDAMAAQHQLTSMRIRHEIMGNLAPYLPVLEPPDGPLVRTEDSGVSITLDRFEMAKEIGATAVLTGNFTMEDTKEGHEILLFLRLVSVEDRIILAATEGLVPHPVTPYSAMDKDHDME